MIFIYSCPECGNPNEFEFIPGEPVKFCLNHDSPEFSNPGSSDEVNGPEQCETCQEPIIQSKVIEQANNKFSDDAREIDE